MTTQRNSNVLRSMLGFIGVVQVFFGIMFTFVPNTFAGMVGLEAAPPWALWMFTMFGARAFGFAYGMFVAMRDPARHSTWIRAMIVVQAVDWIGTLVFLLNGSLTLMQVSTAAVLPVIFIATLVTQFPRERGSAAA
ncbi:MAG: hypothetical protein IAE80_20590 [Anaerolinea sp.]|nr:hypothetical protein [Anaerolinea sp.]